MAKKDLSKVHKAFALSSIIGAMLMAHNNGNPKLVALRVQIDKAMKVYNYKLGRKNYWLMTDAVKQIWVRLAKKHDNTIDEDELSLFIEMVLSLAPKRDMKEFLGVHFTTKNTLADFKKSAILISAMELDEELNILCQTQRTSTREALGLIMVKPVKMKRVKVKQKSVAQIKHENRDTRVKSTLQEMIAAAKLKKD